MTVSAALASVEAWVTSTRAALDSGAREPRPLTVPQRRSTRTTVPLFTPAHANL